MSKSLPVSSGGGETSFTILAATSSTGGRVSGASPGMGRVRIAVRAAPGLMQLIFRGVFGPAAHKYFQAAFEAP